MSLKPEPFSRESRKGLKNLERMLKLALADVRAIKTSDDHERLHMVGESLYEGWKSARDVYQQIDVYSVRRKKQFTHLLPAPAPTPYEKPPIVTMPRQMLLLPGPTFQGEEVQ